MEPTQRWYQGISKYQWLVLFIASLGWVFDVFEGQVFVASMDELAKELLGSDATEGDRSFYNNISMGMFLFGGAIGGVAFGVVSDRIGRARTMILTILMYSIFTCLTAFAQQWWHVAVLRFLVAMGVGGEWAVASSMVAEHFPARSRAWSGAIFHASSVFGTFLAVIVGEYIVANPELGWRWAFGIGVVPALLTLWIRFQLRDGPANVQWEGAQRDGTKWEGAKWEGAKWEGAKWEGAKWEGAKWEGAKWEGAKWEGEAPAEPTSASPPDGSAGASPSQGASPSPKASPSPHGKRLPAASFHELFVGESLRHLVLGVSLATVGLATFWGVHIYGKDALRSAKLRALQVESVDVQSATSLRILKRTQMAGMFLTTIGGGAGLLTFGPLCAWLGRRPAFALFHLGGFALGLVLFGGLRAAEFWTVACLLPLFGFLTLGMHAGYAIYFPELFPARLRGAGAGFCFNVGRVIAAPVLFGSGYVQKEYGISLYQSASALSVLFLCGLIVLWFAPETKGKELA